MPSLPPCKQPGYFRRRKTWRCGKTAIRKRSTHHSLKPCDRGMVRSRRTNRCGMLKPTERRVRHHGMKACEPGYSRETSKTNRCKKIA